MFHSQVISNPNYRLPIGEPLVRIIRFRFRDNRPGMLAPIIRGWGFWKMSGVERIRVLTRQFNYRHFPSRFGVGDSPVRRAAGFSQYSGRTGVTYRGVWET